MVMVVVQGPCVDCKAVNPTASLDGARRCWMGNEWRGQHLSLAHSDCKVENWIKKELANDLFLLYLFTFFIYEVLWEYSCAHSVTYYLWLFSLYVGGVE